MHHRQENASLKTPVSIRLFIFPTEVLGKGHYVRGRIALVGLFTRKLLTQKVRLLNVEAR